MTAPTNAEEALQQAALGPKKVRVGNEEVEQPSLKELQDVADREAGKTASTRNHLGVMFRQIVPPGAG